MIRMRVRVNRPTINWSEVWISTDWSYRSGPSAHVAFFLGSIVHLRHEALIWTAWCVANGASRIRNPPL